MTQKDKILIAIVIFICSIVFSGIIALKGTQEIERLENRIAVLERQNNNIINSLSDYDSEIDISNFD
jgi:cell division protein FtsL